ncbi:MAG: L,D-transpeptidase [Gemmatimonadota bacterium]
MDTEPTSPLAITAPTFRRVALAMAGIGLGLGGVVAWLTPAARAAQADLAAAEQQRDSVRREAAAAGDSLSAALAAKGGAPGDTAYLVVSIAENRLWLKRRDSVLFTTRVATGTGGELKRVGSKAMWKFDTPRGRLKVERKDENPMWAPPDWHFVELAKKRKLKLVFLRAGMTVPLPDGSMIALSGNDVVRRSPNGAEVPYDAREGREIIVGRPHKGPPQGTHQRRFAGVLGPFRLYLGDGYGIHGTDIPSSIGRSASHGCIRVRNEDIEALYQLVPVGTPVFVY